MFFSIPKNVVSPVTFYKFQLNSMIFKNFTTQMRINEKQYQIIINKIEKAVLITAIKGKRVNRNLNCSRPRLSALTTIHKKVQQKLVYLKSHSAKITPTKIEFL